MQREAQSYSSSQVAHQAALPRIGVVGGGRNSHQGPHPGGRRGIPEGNRRASGVTGWGQGVLGSLNAFICLCLVLNETAASSTSTAAAVRLNGAPHQEALKRC